MHRKNTFYRMLVSEGDVDEWLDLAENADHAIMTDLGHVGILDGLDISEAGVPNLTVECSEGVAYDQTGQRMYVPSTQIVNVAVDSDGVSTDVGTPGNIRWVSIFLRFKRSLSNPKTDGNNVTVMYNRDESFEFVVEQSAEGANPARPGLKSDAILLADIQRHNADTTIVTADIDVTRRQWAFDVSAGNYSIKKGQAESAIGEMLSTFNTYVTGLAGGTGAAQIGYAGGGAWADGTTNPATTVEAQLDKVVTDLGGTGGAAKIGSVATGDVVATTVQGAIAELASEKGNKGTTNTWAAANTFQHDVTVSASGAARTITTKLLPTTGANETTKVFEVYAAGHTTGAITIDSSPPDGHLTRYEIDLLACRVGDLTNYQVSKHIGTVRRSGGTVTIAAETEINDFTHGTEVGVGFPAFDISGTTVRLSIDTAGTSNIRLIVRRHCISA